VVPTLWTVVECGESDVDKSTGEESDQTSRTADVVMIKVRGISRPCAGSCI
jgi:hypothetical protein